MTRILLHKSCTLTTGQINASESLFTYLEGLYASNFSHPEHMPIFLDEAIANAPQDIVDICGSNQECIFDSIQTGDTSIGLTTADTNSRNSIDDIQLRKKSLTQNSFFFQFCTLI